MEEDKFQMTNNKCQLKSQNPSSKFQVIKIHIILILLLLVNCVKFHKKQTVIEPVNVAIIDESRVDNKKIRHIFEEFLLKEIIDKGKGKLTIFDRDTLSKEDIQSGYSGYIVIFDIMDYGTFDIEQGIDNILASVKIVKCEDNIVLGSFIESTKGKDIEKISEYLAGKLGEAVIKKILLLQTRTYEVPDILNEPEDSSRIQQ